MTQALQRELHAVQGREAESAALSSERDALQSRVQRLEEAEEVLHSELATAQSDLATMTSQANTHCMATERVGHSTRALLMYHTVMFTCSGPVGATECEGGTGKGEGETRRE